MPRMRRLVRMLAVAATLGAATLSAAKPKPPPAPPAKGSGDGAMTLDFKPRVTFLAYAARVLGVKPGDMDGGAIDPVSAAGAEGSIGGVWAYDVWNKAEPIATRHVRGWVTADSTLVTADQNLGLMLAAAGVWKAPLDADAVAERIARALVWSYGLSNNGLVEEISNGMTPPVLKLAADGTGALRFYTSYRQSGPGGAGGGPVWYTRNDLAIAAGHQATLTKTPAKEPFKTP